MLPAIYFIFSRAACDDAVAQCVREGRRLTTAEERRQIRAIAEAHVDALSDDDLRVLDYGDLVGRAGSRLRRPPRRHGAAVQGGGRGLLRGRPGQGGLRHRDAVPRDQHAGPLGRDREAHQVHRGAPRVPHPGGVHPAHRPGRPPRDRRRRLRHGAVVAVRALRPGRRAGRHPHLRPHEQLPAHLQHGGQPGPALPARHGPPSAQPVVRPVPGRQRRGPPRGPAGAHPSGADRGPGGRGLRSGRRRGVPGPAAGQRGTGPAAPVHDRRGAAPPSKRVRPGDVLVVPGGKSGGRVAVLSTSRRRGGDIRLRAITPDRRLVSLGPGDFPAPPQAVAQVELAGPVRAQQRRLPAPGGVGPDRPPGCGRTAC